MADLRAIQYFEAVYRLASFSKAAEELRLSHSAVTRSIQLLEDRWGTTLFTRTTRSVIPTGAGQRLYPLALEMLAFFETAKRETISGDREIGLISGPVALDVLLPSSIIEFRKTAPTVKITADIMPPVLAIQELLQRRVTLLLFAKSTLAAMPHGDRFEFKEIMVEDYIAVFRPGHAIDGPDIPVQAALEFPWVFPGYDKYTDAEMPDGMRDALTASDAPLYNIYSPTACMNLSISSDVISIIPISLAAPFLNSGALAWKRVPGIPKYRLSAAFMRDVKLDPHVQLFVDSMIEAGDMIERTSSMLLQKSA
jgi:DNA-binding transcriptional LysR family regulator